MKGELRRPACSVSLLKLAAAKQASEGAEAARAGARQSWARSYW